MKDWLSLSSLREMKTSLLSGYEFDHVSSGHVKIIVAAGKFGLLRKMQVMLAELLSEQILNICIFYLIFLLHM